MHIGIFATADEASRHGADVVQQLFADNPDATLGVATGSTPELLYSCMRDDHAAGKLDLSNTTAFALDDYVGLPEDDPESYRNVLIRELVGPEKTGLKAENLHTPAQGMDPANPQAAADKFDAAIKATGIDLQILGIGADGHIAFNEPGGSLVSRTHYAALAPQTISDNARFFDNDLSRVPKTCVTQGLGTIMEAKQILLLAFGFNKADAVHELSEGAISSYWPATILQMHPNATLLLDDESASKLQLRKHYKAQWMLRHPGFEG